MEAASQAVDESVHSQELWVAVEWACGAGHGQNYHVCALVHAALQRHGGVHVCLAAAL